MSAPQLLFIITSLLYLPAGLFLVEFKRTNKWWIDNSEHADVREELNFLDEVCFKLRWVPIVNVSVAFILCAGSLIRNFITNDK